MVQYGALFDGVFIAENWRSVSDESVWGGGNRRTRRGKRDEERGVPATKKGIENPS